MPTILIAEDESLIALDLAHLCEDEGWLCAGPFATCEDALQWLDDASPDVALLDADLRDGSCLAIVRVLEERNIPWAILSGHEQRNAFGVLREVIWIEKPASPEVVRDVLRSLLLL